MVGIIQRSNALAVFYSSYLLQYVSGILVIWKNRSHLITAIQIYNAINVSYFSFTVSLLTHTLIATLSSLTVTVTLFIVTGVTQVLQVPYTPNCITSPSYHTPA